MLSFPDIFSAISWNGATAGSVDLTFKGGPTRDRCCLHLVLARYDLCCTLTDDHTGSHGVTGCHAWHDRSIRDAKVVDTVDFEEAIHHTHGVPAHLGGLRLMPKAKCCVADVVVQF